MRRRRIIASALAGTLIAAAAGCSPPAVRAKVELPPPTTQQQIGDLRATPELQRLVEELSREASQGIVEGLSDAETKARLRGVIGEITRALIEELTAGVRAPATREATAGATRSVLRSFSDELQSSLGPAMRQMIVDDLLRQPDFRQALNETTRDIGKQVALGSAEGVAEATKKEERSLLPLAADLLPTAVWLVLLLVVALALGIPLAVLLAQRRHARRFREITERRTAVAAALLKAVDTERADPALHELLAQIAASLKGDGAQPAEGAPAEPREPPERTLRPA